MSSGASSVPGRYSLCIARGLKLLRLPMRRWFLLPGSALLVLAGGCHSHYIQATIVNSSAAPLNVIQVEYPSASFGTQQLQPGATFQYRFKLLGSGPVKVSFIDAKNGEHAQTGPSLNEGQEGQLRIVLTQSQVQFSRTLRP